MITIGILVGGTVGGWLGALMSNNNWMSGWSILLSGVGSIVGIWVGFKIAKSSGL